MRNQPREPRILGGRDPAHAPYRHDLRDFGNLPSFGNRAFSKGPRAQGEGGREEKKNAKSRNGVGLDKIWRKGRDKSLGREAESQWIVAARLLCHLQYLVPYLSRLQRIHLPDRLEFQYKAPGAGFFRRTEETLDLCFWERTSAPICSRVTIGEVESAASSTDSDLEAFSHNPTHGSFASLAFQPNAMTNYVNQRFLSY